MKKLVLKARVDISKDKVVHRTNDISQLLRTSPDLGHETRKG